SSHYMDDVERIGGRVVLLDKGVVRLDSSLDKLREDYCLAVVPGQFAEHFRRADTRPAGLVHIRSTAGSCHLVFRGDLQAVERDLLKWLNPEDVRCTHLTLEELFVELMGHEAHALACLSASEAGCFLEDRVCSRWCLSRWRTYRP